MEGKKLAYKIICSCDVILGLVSKNKLYSLLLTFVMTGKMNYFLSPDKFFATMFNLIHTTNFFIYLNIASVARISFSFSGHECKSYEDVKLGFLIYQVLVLQVVIRFTIEFIMWGVSTISLCFFFESLTVYYSSVSYLVDLHVCKIKLRALDLKFDRILGFSCTTKEVRSFTKSYLEIGDHIRKATQRFSYVVSIYRVRQYVLSFCRGIKKEWKE